MKTSSQAPLDMLRVYDSSSEKRQEKTAAFEKKFADSVAKVAVMTD
jgi:hypothetical protein